MKKIKWKSDKRKISELKEFSDNPRRMSKKMAQELEKSIKRFGQCVPIQINTDNEIIGGHQRVKILKKLGFTEVLVNLPEEPLSEFEKKELCIRLNKNSGIFDDDMLANAWEVDLLLDCGFTPQELHMDLPEPEKERSKGTSINISLVDDEHASMLERHLTSVLCDYPGSKMKVRRK